MEIGEEFKYSPPYDELQRFVPITLLQPSCKIGYKCPTCSRIYKTEKSLDAHLRNICSEKMNMLPHEGSSSSNIMEPTHDMETKNDPNTNIEYKCNTCCKIYNQKNNWKRHVRFECGKESHFFCEHCSYSSNRKHNLAKHIKSKHEPSGKKNINQEQPIKTYVCGICKRSYKYKNSLNEHWKFKHGTVPAFSCDHCSYSSKRKGDLAMHIKANHNYRKNVELKKPTKSYECETCHKSYSSVGGLSAHRSHDCGKQKSFGCKLCDFSCKRKYGLKQHIANAHEVGNSMPRHECTKCGRTYKNKNILSRHIKYHCQS